MAGSKDTGIKVPAEETTLGPLVNRIRAEAAKLLTQLDPDDYTDTDTDDKHTDAEHAVDALKALSTLPPVPFPYGDLAVTVPAHRRSDDTLERAKDLGAWTELVARKLDGVQYVDGLKDFLDVLEEAQGWWNEVGGASLDDLPEN